MRFGVLGRVLVWTAAGKPVPVPETKVRALLADLLAHQGKPVSADRLIDDLWGADLPANPTSTLQLKVSRLRHALEQAEAGGGELVATHPPGYLLRIDPGAMDADRFAELASRAQEVEDPRTRAALLADALALWRGPAFADFSEEDFARPAAHRLEEQRLAAVETQAEARLELGEYDLLVGELGDLVARYPLRERLRGVQMRALYRAGRQSDALAGYGELRERLAEELGLDPCPELVALHQAILEQDPALSPPLSPVALPRTNLPAPLTGLVGRAQAVDDVRSLLGTARLVTLTGPGGVGKTRLALETAGRMAEDYPDGVWLVDLTGHGEGESECIKPDDPPQGVEELSRIISAVLGFRDDTSDGLPLASSELLIDLLRTRRLLLVLDDCEHVIEPAAKLAERLLRMVPGLRILATSQEPLAVSGEAIWPVPALALPDPSAGSDPAVLAQAGAVQLFVQRTAAALPHFTLDAGNAADVAELCRRLDGIPLALELAATRVPALGLHELVRRLDDRFRTLATGRRGAPARQQTLRAMIDWSWDLLSTSERIVLRRLAIQGGGCTLPAAEAVCSGDGMSAEDVLAVLARLVDRSLVVMTENADGPRYHLLETVADYGRERLREAGELDSVRQRFHHYYLTLVKRAEPHLRGHDQREWLDRLGREGGNWCGVLDGMVRRGDRTGAFELVTTLAWSLYLLGQLGLACNSFWRALAAGGDVPASLQATARAWRAGMWLLVEGHGDNQARTCVAEQAFEDIEDPRERARAQWFLGFALYTSLSDLAASEELVNRALATFREIGDRWGTAAALSTAAHQAMVRGNLQSLRQYGEQSAQLFRELGDRWGQLQTIRPLAYLAEVLGDYEQATRLQRDGLRMAEELRFWPDVAERLMGLGRIALLTRDFAQARELHERCERLSAERNHKRGEIYAKAGLALIARREGELDRAEELLNGLLEWHRHVAFAAGDAFYLAELGFVAEQRGDAETALSRHLDGLTAARTTGDPRAVALALEGLAGAQTLMGHHDEAARLLGTADAARRSAGAPLPAAERGDVDRITTRARTALGEDAFATEFERGTVLDPDDYG
ncbi:BTAD domain-containing putative transcriptional regulator [Nonomuraea sp. M3C6]|uniref:BTAD domain-containing putative transcriptional regulator n=1 Tax=Nonomuraea marmarensis TaxID=3351344 RepID=A0ABW7AKB0_9ACTN